MSYTATAFSDIRVYLGPSAGGEVTAPGDLATYLVPLVAERHAGGERLDFANFRYDLAQTGEHVENLRTPTGWARQIEIRKYTGGGSFVPLFWGDLTQQRIAVRNRGGEAVQVRAAIFPYHFGTTVRGPLVFDPLAGENVTLDESLTLNPNIDGEIRPNMSSRTAGQHRLWGDPESFRTTEAETYQAATLERWTIEEAVKALCWIANGQEEFIKNPLPGDYAVFSAAPEPENLELLRGRHLPYYLDTLLHPYGYGWFVKLTESGGSTERRIALFKRGEGTSLTVRMQPWGEAIEIDTAEASHTNCHGFDLATEVGNVANKVRVIGGRKQYEITFELYRGWPEADDALTEADLDKSDPDSDYHTAGKTLPWRLWVANEAGDYCETRTVTEPIPAAPRDWSEFGVKVPRRREIEDCLTYAADKKRRPPFLEYSIDGGTEWLPVPQAWPYVIYKTQMAIEFTDDTPPGELIAAGEDAKLRVTCTITGDERLVEEADTDGDSPNGRASELEIDASERYAFREVVTTGAYASEINDGTEDADERDDADALRTFAEAIRENEESADMSGALQLIGINPDPGYEIGDVIPKVEGREVSLDRNSEAAAAPKYVQVLGKVYRFEDSETDLVTAAQVVDPFYRPGARPSGVAGVKVRG